MRTRMMVRILIICLVCIPTLSLASPHKIRRNIEKLVQSFDPDVNIGITVRDLTKQRNIVEKNGDRYYVPASNLKLYTDAAAMLALGTDYQFTTALGTSVPKITQQTLKGNVYIKFSGDPTLTTERLVELLKTLNTLNVTTITGHVILDTKSFQNRPYGPGWMIEDSVFAFEVKHTPLILDKNAFGLSIVPSGKDAQLASVELKDKDGHIKLVNKLVSKDDDEFCQVDFNMDKNNTLTVAGCVSSNQGSMYKTLAVANPLVYFKNTLKTELKRLGIQLKGDVHEGVAPKKMRVLAVDHSVPLKEIVRETLSTSDNLYANMVFLKLGALHYNKPTNWRMSGKALKTILSDKLGVDLEGSLILDGAGLSRYNLVTPNQTVELLAGMYYQGKVGEDFLNVMPVVGRDGTLLWRMRENKKIARRVRAKTGSLSGVSTLSGYVKGRNGHVYAFSIFINGISGKHGKYHRLQDKICAVLARA